MTQQQQQQPRFTPEYRLTLRNVIFRLVEREAIGKQSQLMRDAQYLAQRDVRAVTDEVMK